MASRIEFHVLNVGQGSGNFVEIFKDASQQVATTTVLIDLGTEGARKNHNGPGVETVIARLKAMPSPEIACLCLSHSDTDHVSMILDLLQAFDPPGTRDPKLKILTIKSAFYGGNPALYKKSKKTANILVRLKRYMKEGSAVESVTNNTSTYDDSAPALYVDDTLKLKIKLLIGNTTAGTDQVITDSNKLAKTGSLNLNTVSLVVVVDWNDMQFITTGDATGITMLRANGVMKDQPGSFFTYPIMLTTPHHGSRTSAFDFTGTGISNPQLKLAHIDLFARRCGARVLTASAGENKRYKHPSAQILDIFWRYCSDFVPYRDPVAIHEAHFYTAYFADDYGFSMHTIPFATVPWPGPRANRWYTLQTSVPVFTTDYFAPNNLIVATVVEAPTMFGPGGTRNYMGLLPSSKTRPSPGWPQLIPDPSKFPSREVGWTIRLAEDKAYSMVPIKPNTQSIAARHAIVDLRERLRAEEESLDVAATRSTATGRPTSPPSVTRSGPSPLTRSRPAATRTAPRPKRR
jgi:beta-lactamase superfamily II metal-dependent hydrolase